MKSRGEAMPAPVSTPQLPSWFTTEGSKWPKLREIGAAASADPRTVEREVLEPGSVRGMVGDRIRRALKDAAESEAQS